MSSTAVQIASLCGSAFVGGAVAAYLLTRRKPRPILEAVQTSTASPAAGHYSQAIKNGGEVFVSGLLPITPDGTKLADQPFEAQASRVLANLEEILKAAGSDITRLIQVRVYISNIDNWPAFNKLYSEKLGSHKPARCVVPVPCLHYGFEIELEAIAAL